MARTEYTEFSKMRRVDGLKVQVEGSYDGVQRREELYVSAREVGYISTARWNAYVSALTPRGKEQLFHTASYGTKDKAFTAARAWLVAQFKEA